MIGFFLALLDYTNLATATFSTITKIREKFNTPDQLSILNKTIRKTFQKSSLNLHNRRINLEALRAIENDLNSGSVNLSIESVAEVFKVSPTELELTKKEFLRQLSKIDNHKLISQEAIFDIQEKVTSLPQQVAQEVAQLLKEETITKKIVIEENHPIVKDFIPRSIFEPKDEEYYFLADKITLLKVLSKHNRVLLLGGACEGKSTELLQLASNYSKTFCKIILLRNYTGENFINELADVVNITEANKLYLFLDGYDELINKHRSDFIAYLNQCIEKYPKLNIVMTSRSNFISNSDIFPLFKYFKLSTLSYEEIKKYVETKLKIKARAFLDQVENRNLYHLIQTPFYLCVLVDLYDRDMSLPRNKSELYKQLITNSLSADIKQASHKLEELEDTEYIIGILKKVAFIMEVFGQNSINTESYYKIISNETDRVLLRRCSLWKWNVNSNNWGFIHNNFQEYLAAKYISNIEFKKVKEIVSVLNESKLINPSWVNTLSFLVELKPDTEIYNWILETQAEIFFTTDYEQIPIEIRSEVSIKIIEYYNSKNIFIDSILYNPKDLTRFGNSSAFQSYLLESLITYKDFHHSLSNTIQLLAYTTLNSTNLRILKTILVDYVRIIHFESFVYESIFYALRKLDLIDKNNLKEIIQVHSNSTNTHILYSLYRLIHSSEFVNEHIEFLLGKVERAVSHQPEVYGNERMELTSAFLKITKPKAVKALINEFISSNMLHNLFLEEKDFKQFTENFYISYTIDHSISADILKLYKYLCENGPKNFASELCKFFDKNDSRVSIFTKLFDEYQDKNLWKLGPIIDQDCIDKIIKDYKNSLISDSIIIDFKFALNQSNEELYKYYYKQINLVSKDSFIDPPTRNYMEEEKEKKLNNVDVLFNQDTFIEKVNFALSDVDEKTLLNWVNICELIRESYKWSDHPRIVNDFLRKYSRENPATTKSSLINFLENQNWSNVIIKSIYEFMKDYENEYFSENQIEKINDWCLSESQKINPDGNCTFTYNSRYVTFFLRKFSFKNYSTDTLLCLTLFDIENEGISYLEDFVDSELLRSQVIKNIKIKNLHKFHLKNQFDYLISIDETALIPVLDKYIIESNDPDFQQDCLKYLSNFENTESYFEQYLEMLNNKCLNFCIEYLTEKKNHFCKDFLLKKLRKPYCRGKIEFANYLIECDSIEGFDFYINWIITKKKIPNLKRKFDLLNRIEYSKKLIVVLKLNTMKKITLSGRHYQFDSEIRNALKNIALTNWDNYLLVKQDIKELIDENIQKYPNFRHLYHFILTLDQNAKIGFTNNKSIDQVLVYLQGV